jgi:hypothetical protein
MVLLEFLANAGKVCVPTPSLRKADLIQLLQLLLEDTEAQRGPGTSPWPLACSQQSTGRLASCILTQASSCHTLHECLCLLSAAITKYLKLGNLK